MKRDLAGFCARPHPFPVGVSWKGGSRLRERRAAFPLKSRKSQAGCAILRPVESSTKPPGSRSSSIHVADGPKL
jgi:hypothetical protein